MTDLFALREGVVESDIEAGRHLMGVHHVLKNIT